MKTIKEATQMFNVSRQRIQQLMHGHTATKIVEDKVYSYKVKPKLKKDVDWVYDFGYKITDSGIEKLVKHFEQSESR